MIRHVRFSIPLVTERWAAQYLEQMDTYVRSAEVYESQHVSNVGLIALEMGLSIGSTPNHDQYTHLIEHPRYTTGGLREMALFVCLRMLASTFNDTDYTSTLTLPVPSAEDFKAYPRLKWFPILCHGLGIHLRYLEGRELVYSDVSHIVLDWHQKFQKKDFEGEVGKGGVDVDVRKKTLEMYPDFDEREVRLDSCGYYRTSCDGEVVRWYKVWH